MNYKWAFWLLLAGIFILSSLPNLSGTISKGSNSLSFRFDYLFHLLAYTVLTFLYIKAYNPRFRGFLLLTGYAAFEEVHQLIIPGRTMNPVDFGFDLAGITLIFVIWLFMKK